MDLLSFLSVAGCLIKWNLRSLWLTITGKGGTKYSVITKLHDERLHDLAERLHSQTIKTRIDSIYSIVKVSQCEFSLSHYLSSHRSFRQEMHMREQKAATLTGKSLFRFKHICESRLVLNCIREEIQKTNKRKIRGRESF